MFVSFHGGSIEALAARYLDEYAKPRKSSWRNEEIYLRRPRANWGQRDARTISRRDAIVLLDEIKKAAPVSANRTHTVLVTLLNWGVEDQLLDSNPLAGLKKRAVEQAKGRTLSDDEFRVLWRSLDAGGLTTGTSGALKVLAPLGQRPGEIVGMRRSKLVSLETPRCGSMGDSCRTDEGTEVAYRPAAGACPSDHLGNKPPMAIA